MLGGSAKKRSGKIVEVALKSTPAGAQVSLDGKPLGIAAPGKIELEPGKYKFRAEKAGFTPTEKTIEVESGDQSLRLHFELAAAPQPTPAKKDDTKKAKQSVPPITAKTNSRPDLKKRPDVAARVEKPTVGVPATPVKTEPPTTKVRTAKREIAADFATYAPRLIGDRIDRETYLSHVPPSSMKPGRRRSSPQACEIANEHFHAARYINRHAPWAYYAHGLLLSKNKKSGEALAHFEVAAEESLAQRIPLFAPLREVIRLQTLNDDYGPAVHDSLHLAQAVMSFAEAGELGDHAVATVEANVDFVGRIMGFIKGPAENKARTTVDLAAWEGELQAILPSDKWLIYTEAAGRRHARIMRTNSPRRKKRNGHSTSVFKNCVTAARRVRLSSREKATENAAASGCTRSQRHRC